MNDDDSVDINAFVPRNLRSGQPARCCAGLLIPNGTIRTGSELNGNKVASRSHVRESHFRMQLLRSLDLSSLPHDGILHKSSLVISVPSKGQSINLGNEIAFCHRKIRQNRKK